MIIIIHFTYRIFTSIPGLRLISQLNHRYSSAFLTSTFSCLPRILQPGHVSLAVLPRGAQVCSVHTPLCECRGAAFGSCREGTNCVETQSETKS
jgi:hypothetical protein